MFLIVWHTDNHGQWGMLGGALPGLRSGAFQGRRASIINLQ